MFIVPRNHLQHFYSSNIFFYRTLSGIHSQNHSPFSNTIHNPSNLASPNSPTAPFRFHYIKLLYEFLPKQLRVSFYSSRTYRGPLTRSLRKRIRKREKAAAKPVLNEAQFQRAITELPPRFTPEELHNVMTLQVDPLVCLELFNWASQQHRFRHNGLTYHITIKVLGAAKMYQEMDDVVNQVLAVPSIGSEALYNTMIYYFIEARKLIRAINIYKAYA
ncbi:Pentatricopeptide repeat-containing protein [Abeliophyllum distichum]|uniref:Pentatricopeptide repeat-containing protein n=1 Tax=Abeliophyllum distichum TaxID=126358 RepID=A0ABD1VUS9_9LAMI